MSVPPLLQFANHHCVQLTIKSDLRFAASAMPQKSTLIKVADVTFHSFDPGSVQVGIKIQSSRNLLHKFDSSATSN